MANEINKGKSLLGLNIGPDGRVSFEDNFKKAVQDKMDEAREERERQATGKQPGDDFEYINTTDNGQQTTDDKLTPEWQKEQKPAEPAIKVPLRPDNDGTSDIERMNERIKDMTPWVKDDAIRIMAEDMDGDVSRLSGAIANRAIEKAQAEANKAYEAGTEKESEMREALARAGAPALAVAGAGIEQGVETSRAYWKNLTPEAVNKRIEESLNAISYLDIDAAAKKAGVDTDWYMNNAIAPQLQKTIYNKLLDKHVPQSTLEYVASGAFNSIIGQIAETIYYPTEIRQMRAQGRQIAGEREGAWAEMGNMGVGFLADAPIFKGIGGLVGKLRYAGPNKALGMALDYSRGGLNFGGYNAISTTTGAIHQNGKITGEDVAKAAEEAGKGFVMGTAMGITGSKIQKSIAGWSQNNGISYGVRLGTRAAQLANNTAVMATADMLMNPDTDILSGKDWLEQGKNALMMNVVMDTMHAVESIAKKPAVPYKERGIDIQAMKNAGIPVRSEKELYRWLTQPGQSKSRLVEDILKNNKLSVEDKNEAYKLISGDMNDAIHLHPTLDAAINGTMDGRWVVQESDALGTINRRKVFATKEEAEAYRESLQPEIMRNQTDYVEQMDNARNETVAMQEGIKVVAQESGKEVSKIKAIILKNGDGEKLTKEEEALREQVFSYRDAYRDYATTTREEALEAVELANGMEAGSMEAVLQKDYKNLDDAERKAVQDYNGIMRERLSGKGEAEGVTGAREDLFTPEQRQQSQEKGARLYVNGNYDAMRQQRMRVEQAAERVNSAFGAGFANTLEERGLRAVEELTENGAELSAYHEELITDYLMEKQAMDTMLEQMDAAHKVEIDVARTAVNDMSPMQDENGNTIIRIVGVNGKVFVVRNQAGDSMMLTPVELRADGTIDWSTYDAQNVQGRDWKPGMRYQDVLGSDIMKELIPEYMQEYNAIFGERAPEVGMELNMPAENGQMERVKLMGQDAAGNWVGNGTMGEYTLTDADVRKMVAEQEKAAVEAEGLEKSRQRQREFEEELRQQGYEIPEEKAPVNWSRDGYKINEEGKEVRAGVQETAEKMVEDAEGDAGVALQAVRNKQAKIRTELDKIRKEHEGETETSKLLEQKKQYDALNNELDYWNRVEAWHTYKLAAEKEVPLMTKQRAELMYKFAEKIGSKLAISTNMFATMNRLYAEGVSDYKPESVEDANLFNGLNLGGKIYINGESVRGLLWAFGHESGHTIAAASREDYNAFKDAIRATMGEEAWEAAKKAKSRIDVYSGKKEEAVEEEVVNDQIGEIFKDPNKFDTFAKLLVDGRKKTAIKALWNATKKFANNMSLEGLKDVTADLKKEWETVTYQFDGAEKKLAEAYGILEKPAANAEGTEVMEASKEERLMFSKEIGRELAENTNGKLLPMVKGEITREEVEKALESNLLKQWLKAKGKDQGFQLFSHGSMMLRDIARARLGIKNKYTVDGMFYNAADELAYIMNIAKKNGLSAEIAYKYDLGNADALKKVIQSGEPMYTEEELKAIEAAIPAAGKDALRSSVQAFEDEGKIREEIERIKDYDNGNAVTKAFVLYDIALNRMIDQYKGDEQYTKPNDKGGYSLKANVARELIEEIATTPIVSEEIEAAAEQQPALTDARFSKEGEKGVRRLVEAGLEEDNLAIAKEMREAGKDALTIKMATGWEYGHDGKWKKEDEDLHFKDGVFEKYQKLVNEGKSWIFKRLPEVMGDSRLFTAYPKLKDVILNVEVNWPAGQRGAYDKDYGWLSLNNRLFEGGTAEAKRRVEEIIAHEVQHFIQDEEGFAIGGTPNTPTWMVLEANMTPEEKEAHRKAIKLQAQSADALESLREQSESLKEMSFDKSGYRTIQEFLDTKEAKWQPAVKMMKDLDAEYEAARKELIDSKKEASDIKEKVRERLGIDKWFLGLDGYHRLAGEVEARSVGNRVNMWNDYRRKVLTEVDEDVPASDQILRFSKETDPETLKKLENEETVKVYRAIRVNEDGTLSSPMAGGGVGGKRKGERVETYQPKFGEWEKADEHPELATMKEGEEYGHVTIDKGEGNGTLEVAYNPYIHTSRQMLNDQFSSAWRRPNLQVMEVEVPVSELTSGYRADMAKNAVGETEWTDGVVAKQLEGDKKRKVILSRWDKPVRIVPVEEYAKAVKEQLDGSKVEGIPFNCVTPEQREALVKEGIKILEPEKKAGAEAVKAYEDWEKAVEQQPAQNGMFEYFKGTIGELISETKKKGKKLIKKILNPVSSRLKNELSEQGVDIDGYNHVIDNSAIQHIFKKHGSDAEYKRGQIPVTVEDIERIPDVIDNYDGIKVEERNNINIVYNKSYPDGTTIYVEERRSGRKELAAVSMWKMKKTTLTDANRKNTTPISDLDGSSKGKGTENISNGQENGEKFSKEAPTKPKEGENFLDYANRVMVEERTGVDTNPSEAQKEAGNYKKGHIRLDGYDITIENPKGSTRSGKDADGKEWSVKMNYDYGYIRGTKGVDGDHIDVYLGADQENGKVFVVDQIDQKTGKFDEHKVMYGFPDAESAIEAYKSQYEDGWKVGPVTEVTKDEFKTWVDSSTRKTKPFGEYKAFMDRDAINGNVPASETYGRTDMMPDDVNNGGNVLRIGEKVISLQADDADYVRRQRESLPKGKAWRGDFPQTVVITSNVQSRFPELYKQAKAGDREAAFELVSKISESKTVADKIDKLVADYPDAIVAYPHAEEAAGRNKIPQALAAKLESAGLRMTDEIRQINKPNHTGASDESRLVRRSRFEGTVEHGGKYILLDDQVSSGATLRDMKDYIESQGGEVVQIVGMTASMGGHKIAPSEAHINKLRELGVTDKQLQDYGIAEGAEYFTDGEAAKLIRLVNRGGAGRAETGPEGISSLVQGEVRRAESKPQPGEHWLDYANRVAKEGLAVSKPSEVKGAAVEPQPAGNKPKFSKEIDGRQMVMQSLLDEIDNVNRNEETVRSEGDLSELRLRPLEEGETCHVQRRYEEAKQFSFTSGKEKVESMDDVAYIFKQLEDKAVENVFLCMVKDGKPSVIHLGMGGYAEVPVDLRPSFGAFYDIKPDKVWLVHNHPSGNVTASKQDRDLLMRIIRLYGKSVVQPGIIIDTNRGVYGEFGFYNDTNEMRMPENVEAEIPIKTYSFSKQVFEPGWNPSEAFRATSSSEVAQFVSSHRLGEHKKMGLMVMNNHFDMTGNFFLPYTSIRQLREGRSVDAAARELAYYINMAGGTRGILYGNYEYQPKEETELKSLARAMQDLNTPLADVMHFDSQKDYHSASEEGMMEPEVKFSKEIDEIFYSNARKAVEDIKQEKATPEQWLAMIQKNGGLKAGEDKWMGLSEWLKSRDAKTLTKDEVMKFIQENQIQVEEQRYEEMPVLENNPILQAYRQEFNAIAEELSAEREKAYKNSEEFEEKMYEKYGYDWFAKITDEENKTWNELVNKFNSIDNTDAGVFDEMVNRHGDDFRMAFHVEGGELEPEIDYPYGVNDAARTLLNIQEKQINETRFEYTTKGLDNKKEIALVVPTIESWNEGDDIHFGDAGEGRAIAWVRFGETTDTDGNRVNVIDEIQSKRHQDGKKDGYKNFEELQNLSEELVSLRLEQKEIEAREKELYIEIGKSDKVKPLLDADGYIKPETKEEYDRIVGENEELVAQNKRWRVVTSRIQEIKNEIASKDRGVPDAPFDKNWMELGMKRMLRYAAENGYDKLAWTTGAQQAERYDIGKVIDQVERSQTFGETGETRFDLQPKDNSGSISLFVKDGIVTRSTQEEFEGKRLDEVVGKELAAKMMEMPDYSSIDIQEMNIGGQGMVAFYDRMIPSFMNKYCKKWGTQVHEVELPDLEPSAQKMWAVDITPEMKESVMQGQPMFSKEGKSAEWKKAKEELKDYPFALETLRNLEDQDIYDVAASVLAGGNLLWGDKGEGPNRKKGVQSMMGWKEGERKNFLGMFAKDGMTFAQAGEAVEQACREEHIPFDENDPNAGVNALQEVLGSVKSMRGLTNYVELKRVDEARAAVQDAQNHQAEERNEYYLRNYGMSYDEYMTYQEESAKAQAGNGISEEAQRDINWLRTKNERQAQELQRIQKELERLHNEELARPLVITQGKIIEQQKAQLDQTKTELNQLKDATNRKKNYEDAYRQLLEVKRDVANFVREQLAAEDMPFTSKKDLNKLLATIEKTNTVEQLQDALREVQIVAGRGRVKHLDYELSKLLRLQIQGLNGKRMSVAKTVDDRTRRIIEDIRGRVQDIGISGMEEELDGLMRQRREQRGAINELRTKLKDAEAEEKVTLQAKIDEGEKRWQELSEQIQAKADEISEARESKRSKSVEDLTEEINAIIEQADLLAQDGKQLPEAEADKLTALEGFKILQQSKKSANDVYKLEKGIRDLWSKIYELRAEREGKDDKERQRLNKLIINRKDKIKANEALLADAINQQAFDIQEGINMLETLMDEGRNSLKQKMDAALLRRCEMIKNACADVRNKKNQVDFNRGSNPDIKKNPTLKSFINAPVGSFEYMAQRLGQTSKAGKDSWIYQHFVMGKDGVMEAFNTYQRGLREQKDQLNEKVTEIFGTENSKVLHTDAWVRQAEKADKIVYDSGVTIVREDGKREVLPLSKGAATYLYMVWKMEDGKSKMMLQGFDNTSMQEIQDFIGKDYMQLADWLQDTFLVGTRAKYNERYRELYNTSMARIENYVPLRVNKDVTRQESDLSEDKNRRVTLEQRAGSLINRTVNNLPVDITKSVFDVISEHVEQMENWYAYSPVRRDLDAILSNTFFRNQVDANNAGHFKRFYDAAAIATQSYVAPPAEHGDALMAAMTKGLLGGNIAWRAATAIKQLYSASAYLGYTYDPMFVPYLVKNAATGALGLNLQWCIDNIPSFKARVDLGDIGNVRISEKVGDVSGNWAKKLNKYLQNYTAVGMIPNRAIDAITCSMGAKSIYDYKIRQLRLEIEKDKTLTNEQRQEALKEAHRKAVMEADIFYNSTQQSSNPMFLSPMQVSRTLLDRSLTAYQNNNLGYVRKMLEAAYDLIQSAQYQKMKDAYKDSYTEDGVPEEEANTMARRQVLKTMGKSLLGLFVMGWLNKYLWDKGSTGFFGFWADPIADANEKQENESDDEYKNRMQWESFYDWIGVPARPLQGTPMGNYLMSVSEKRSWNPLLVFNELDDLQKDFEHIMKNDGVFSKELLWAVTNHAMRTGGVNLETLGNIYYGLEQMAIDGGGYNEKMIDLMFFLNNPNKGRADAAKNLYKDEDFVQYAQDVAKADKYLTKGTALAHFFPWMKEFNGDGANGKELKREYDKLKKEWEAYNDIDFSKPVSVGAETTKIYINNSKIEDMHEDYLINSILREAEGVNREWNRLKKEDKESDYASSAADDYLELNGKAIAQYKLINKYKQKFGALKRKLNGTTQDETIMDDIRDLRKKFLKEIKDERFLQNYVEEELE